MPPDAVTLASNSPGHSPDEHLALRAVAFDTPRRRTLGPLDVAIPRGESLCVIGPNGAGKTTLLRLLVGLLSPSEGACLVAGCDARDLSRKELARRVAYVPQVRAANVPLSVEQMLLLARYPYFSGWRAGPVARDFEAIDRALNLMGIARLKPCRLDELSGGERQLVYLAAALAQEAEVLVLDEPTSDLDPQHEVAVTRLLRTLRRDRAMTLVTATHDLQFASRVADTVLSLNRGLVGYMGPTKEALSPARLESLFATRFQTLGLAGEFLPVLEFEE